MTRGRPWQTDEWRHVGLQIRDAWRALRRMSLDAYPTRIDWPPRISSDKAFRTSHPQRAVERLDEAERRLQVRTEDVRTGVRELKDVDFELFLALTLREGLLQEGGKLQAGQIAARFSCSESRIYGLLRDAWAFVAWRISHEA